MYRLIEAKFGEHKKFLFARLREILVDFNIKMDSEDDMHDANDLESLEDFYSGDTAIDSDDAADGDYEFIDNDSEDDYDDSSSHRNQVSFANFFLSKFVLICSSDVNCDFCGFECYLEVFAQDFWFQRIVYVLV